MENLEMRFENRTEFRSWLEKHGREGVGLAISFDKTDPKAFKHAEALEEALCFGWIDGILKKTDEQSYTVYFTERRKGSKWSEKNVKAIPGLEARGLMTDFGREKIEEAKKNGSWENPQKLPEFDEEQTKILIRALEGKEPALTHFLNMSHSIQWTYTLLYLDAKTEPTRISRLAKIVDRLNQNLKPM
jgi:uncharacterized protein YdeI (YjbR/CyaY-like superfamily)